MSATLSSESLKELRLYRRLLAIAGSVYFAWWFAVELLLPNSFNPFLGRGIVVATIFAVWIMSYRNETIQRHLRFLFTFCVWLITLHYYYLFYGNAGETNWIIGSYITITAIGLGLLSHRALMAYSIFVLLLSLGLVILLPSLGYSVFLPGLITILIQANIGLRSRFRVLKNLAESNERFQLLFNSTFEGVMVHENGRITNVNESLIRMTGYSRDELIDRDITMVVHPDERTKVAEMIKNTDAIPYETRGLKRDGTAIDIEVRGKEFNYDRHKARLVNIQDITDRKKVEKERVRNMAVMENVRLRDEFISIASHELKTPISSLKLQTQLLERDLSNKQMESFAPEKIKNFLGLFDRQVNRLIELVETMLDVSRIAAGGLHFNFRSVDLSEIVRRVVEEYQKTSTAIVLKAEEPLIIYADTNRIKQVVDTLVNNAIKYGVGRSIQVKLHRDDIWAVLEVEDQGMGIAPEYIDRIFSRFERAISPKNISGLGLGLYVSKQIVEGHYGQISFESELKKGSVFKVRIPLKAV